MRAILSAIAGETGFRPAAATELGVARARDGVPLSIVTAAGKPFCRNVTLVCEEV